MGGACSSCCGGSLLSQGKAPRSLADLLLARTRDGLYDTALAESEREAVAELLGYLENVTALLVNRKSA